MTFIPNPYADHDTRRDANADTTQAGSEIGEKNVRIESKEKETMTGRENGGLYESTLILLSILGGWMIWMKWKSLLARNRSKRRNGESNLEYDSKRWTQEEGLCLLTGTIAGQDSEEEDKLPEVSFLDTGFYHTEDYEIDEEDYLIQCTSDDPYPRNNDAVFTMYKTVAKKVKPVSGTFPEEARVIRTVPRDPLLTLEPLPFHAPDFVPTTKLTNQRMDELEVNKDGFLTTEEEKNISSASMRER